MLFEAVVAKGSPASEEAKLEGPWGIGLWLGRTAETDEHIVGGVSGDPRKDGAQATRESPVASRVGSNVTLDAVVFA